MTSQVTYDERLQNLRSIKRKIYLMHQRMTNLYEKKQTWQRAVKQGIVETAQAYADLKRGQSLHYQTVVDYQITTKHSDVAMVGTEIFAADVVYLCSIVMDIETSNVLFLCNKHTHQQKPSKSTYFDYVAQIVVVLQKLMAQMTQQSSYQPGT